MKKILKNAFGVFAVVAATSMFSTSTEAKTLNKEDIEKLAFVQIDEELSGQQPIYILGSYVYLNSFNIRDVAVATKTADVSGDQVPVLYHRDGAGLWTDTLDNNKTISESELPTFEMTGLIGTLREGHEHLSEWEELYTTVNGYQENATAAYEADNKRTKEVFGKGITGYEFSSNGVKALKDAIVLEDYTNPLIGQNINAIESVNLTGNKTEGYTVTITVKSKLASYDNNHGEKMWNG